ncbi:hypothetical protein [Helicobacter pylori]|uniref:hypothetical protein n=1 Tax=Helicobacter pylori TaxID=210 RepID=UPI000FDDCC2E|nr:hypothetical protein [Helicobacter pylori]RVY77987.1 hypothetical protein ECC47_06315 [Helicobacter pylori]
MLAVKTIKIPLKTTQAEIPNISSVWVLHDKIKKLDFSGGFLSVISGNVILKCPLKSLTAKSKTIPASNQTSVFIAIFD